MPKKACCHVVVGVVGAGGGVVVVVVVIVVVVGVIGNRARGHVPLAAQGPLVILVFILFGCHSRATHIQS